MSAAAGVPPEAVAFEAARRRLVGLAYRMLGSMSDAEDVVQDAWFRWARADQREITNPDGWLTTVTTRLALDRLRAAERRREEYVGPWLPEPVVTDGGPEDAAELADSLTLGFLALLDQLAPIERAVFLLADVFATPYAEIAETVGKSEAACRQIASRARRRLQEGHPRRPHGAERRVVDEMLVAVAMGDVDAVLARLAPDVISVSDGGVQRRAARRPVVGPDRVARFFINLAHRVSADVKFVPTTLNGDPGLAVYEGLTLDFVAVFELNDDERIAAIWIVRNPDKLERVHAALTN